MQDNCQSNCSHDIWTRRGEEVFELEKDMEMACAVVSTSAWQFGVCVSIRSINRPEFRNVYRGLAKESDIDISETRCVDSGYETVQVLASSSIFEACENRENNALPGWRQAEVVSAGWEGKEVK
jgi:hypothetical protein